MKVGEKTGRVGNQGSGGVPEPSVVHRSGTVGTLDIAELYKVMFAANNAFTEARNLADSVTQLAESSRNASMKAEMALKELNALTNRARTSAQISTLEMDIVMMRQDETMSPEEIAEAEEEFRQLMMEDHSDDDECIGSHIVKSHSDHLFEQTGSDD